MAQETKVTIADARDKGCIGCLKFNSDVMITMQGDDGEFNDYFLTTEQATHLKNRIEKVLKDNSEDEVIAQI